MSKENNTRHKRRAVAQELVRRGIAQRLRWCDAGADPGWWAWTGSHWSPTADRIPAALIGGVHSMVGSYLERQAIDQRGARALESAAGIRGVAALLAPLPEMKFPADVDPPNGIAIPSGFLDLVTGELAPHDPARNSGGSNV